MKKTLTQHLDPGQGPKRILALDGGGIRGALTLGYLKRIESILRSANGPDYRLCDHFDLIGGTSTGSIIASALALGMSVDQIRDLYMDLGGKIFDKKNNW
ncbi:MAG: patatin-like phospholipase family protein, partial [Bacteroidota bacterium]